MDSSTNPVAGISCLNSAPFSGLGIEVDLLREDLIDPEIPGNKWRKLRYHVQAAISHEHSALLSFGGPWSNHIDALSAIGARLGMHTIALIRGPEPPGGSETLERARSRGAEVQVLSRSAYALRHDSGFIADILRQWGPVYIVPEGGSGPEGVRGCMEILGTHTQKYDVIACSCGTGTTLAGLLLSLSSNQKLLGFSAVGKGHYLVGNILKMVSGMLDKRFGVKEGEWNIELATEFAFGGFARVKEPLLEFMRGFYLREGIRLDPLYTGKMMFGLARMIEAGHFAPGTRILAVHTGGLQGIAGIERRIGEKLYAEDPQAGGGE